MSMQALDLNLASRPFKNDTLPWVGVVTALILLVLLTTWNVTAYGRHSEDRSRLEGDIAGIRGQMEKLDRRDRDALRAIRDVDLGLLTLKSEKANEVIRWKSFSWTRLFNRLQEVQPWDVQMTAIHPVFRGDNRSQSRRDAVDPNLVPISVEGVAKTYADLLDLEDKLIEDPHFDRVEPENITTDDLTGETIFRLRFMYDPRVRRSDTAAEEAVDVAEATDAAEEEPSVEAQGAEEPGAQVPSPGEPASVQEPAAADPDSLAAEQPASPPDPDAARSRLRDGDVAAGQPAAEAGAEATEPPARKPPRRRGAGRRKAQREAAEQAPPEQVPAETKPADAAAGDPDDDDSNDRLRTPDGAKEDSR